MRLHEVEAAPAPWTPLVRLDPVIERRHTNRRDFFDEDVPPDVDVAHQVRDIIAGVALLLEPLEHEFVCQSLGFKLIR
jgi:hypothetical protein